MSKPISELSDDELAAEASKRRTSRMQKARRAQAEKAGALPTDVRQHYANLELEPGASLEEIEQQYASLRAKYNPNQFTHDPRKHQAASKLLHSLTNAYEQLLQYLS